MLPSTLRAISFVSCLTYALAQTSASSSLFAEVTLTAEDITAKLIPYGARLISLLVPDRSGNVQDIVLGYDNTTQYLTDTETNHTYFGPIVGRYANRIKNGTFTIDGNTYHVPENEHGGLNTLHGGKVGSCAILAQRQARAVHAYPYKPSGRWLHPSPPTAARRGARPVVPEGDHAESGVRMAMGS
jgi:hypothetical protein